MKSVSGKTSTFRRAVATARVRALPETIRRMEANDLPKQNVLVVARVAGVTGAKQTATLIPYCHPLPIDSVEVAFEVAEDHIDITAVVEAVWKTGVEMEALTAVSAAALTIYDMLKPIDKTLVVESTRLDKKRGGKSDFQAKPPAGFTAAVIVTSDGTHRGEREDRSGILIRDRLRAHGVDSDYHVLPDEEDEIVALMRRLVAEGTDLIVTTGGTGLSPRDVTVEAARRVIEREVPGIVEAARAYGQSRTPYAMLSRGVAGVSGRTLIITAPGSSRGAEETITALFPAVLHAFGMLRGEGH